ncbi:MAG: hybrid sensor histidine kinase/response regulator [Cyanobacteria bacterium P01_D01_bin.105]
MLTIFCMEIEKQVVILNDGLLALENQAVARSESAAKTLDSLMRSAHSIKGAARIVGLDTAVEVAHVLEDCFVAIKKGQITLDSQHVDVLLKGIDWFTELGQVKNDAHSEWLIEQTDYTSKLLDQMSALCLAPSENLDAKPSPKEETELKPLKKAASALNKNPQNHKPQNHNPQNHNPQNLKSQNHKLQNHNNIDHLDSSSPEENTHIDSGDEDANRVVKVNADNLNRLMALAGESLVEVNGLQPFVDVMQHLKQQQQSLIHLLNRLQKEAMLPTGEQKRLDSARKIALDCHALLSDRVGELDQFSQRFAQLSDNLYQEVIASHMLPFSNGTQGFSRMVRDLARSQGKQVKLEIVGQNTQIDREILDKLEAPLTHILRNAIAHGIEPPAQRQQLGKPEIGTIRLEARHRAGMLFITVTDDGCGIDLEQLRASVIEKNLTSPSLAAQLSEAELMEFLFLPGFSTAEQVTEIAGRGVGLDIAKSMVQEVGGLLQALNTPGAGLSFHFQLPLTLSVIRALVVEISGEPYAFSLTHIDQVRLVSREEIIVSENCPYFVVDGENVGLVKAQQVLQLPESQLTHETAFPVIIIKNQDSSYGIIVDKLLGERELVVRPLDKRFGKIQDVSAAALTEDGWPLLIIDVADLVCSIEQMASGGMLLLSEDRKDARSLQQQRVLVVDDSLTVREMERQLLQNHGYQVDVAVNGMEGWNTVRTGGYDLVISDIDMPRMNGIELVQHIKDHPQLKQIPVIIVSYKDRKADQLAGLNAGADYYLTKSSFQDDSLITAVKDLIG